MIGKVVESLLNRGYIIGSDKIKYLLLNTECKEKINAGDTVSFKPEVMFVNDEKVYIARFVVKVSL